MDSTCAAPTARKAADDPVMPAAEVQLLIGDLCSELSSAVDAAEARDVWLHIDGALGLGCLPAQICAHGELSSNDIAEFIDPRQSPKSGHRLSLQIRP